MSLNKVSSQAWFRLSILESHYSLQSVEHPDIFRPIEDLRVGSPPRRTDIEHIEAILLGCRRSPVGKPERANRELCKGKDTWDGMRRQRAHSKHRFQHGAEGVDMNESGRQLVVRDPREENFPRDPHLPRHKY